MHGCLGWSSLEYPGGWRVDVRWGQLCVPPSPGRKGQGGAVQCEVIPAGGGVVGCPIVTGGTVTLTTSGDVTLANRSNTRATLWRHHANCECANVFLVTKTIKSLNL